MNPINRHANYFDHAATTPLHPQVRAAMEPYWRELFGNSHSPHHWGEAARDAIEQAKSHIGQLFDAPAEGVILTSGATEANHIVALSFENTFVGQIEHSSIANLGLPPFSSAIPAHAELLSQMVVNNETGEILAPPPEGGWFIHRDAVQSVGYLDLTQIPGDIFTLSAHKIYGPPGIGAIVCRGFVPLKPLVRGVEGELRAGTTPLPLIVGFGAACSIAQAEQHTRLNHAHKLRAELLNNLNGQTDFVVLDSPNQAPHIVNMAFRGIEGAALVLAVDALGFAISAGAACSTGSTETSHVIKARQLSSQFERGAIRVSFGLDNTLESTQSLSSAIIAGARDLMRLGR